MIELPALAWPAMALAVLVAYTVVGLMGFGAVLVAMPVLVLFLPLKVAVPMMMVFDLGATLAIGAGNRQLLARPELWRLLPLMLLGASVGASMLATLDARPLLVALGLFVGVNALWMIWAPPARQGLNAWWAVPTGLVGGVFSGMFGTGGPIYAIYLARRLGDMARLRATTAGVLLGSAVMRLVLFALLGLYQQPGIFWLMLALAPGAAAGVWLGSRMAGRWPQARLRRILLAVLLAGAVSALVKGLGG